MLENIDWGMITDVILGAAILWVGILVILGICQWIHRKSFFKIDKWILWMGVIMIAMGLVYLFFDKVLILGYSPKNPEKPSFPSSHTMVVWTIFLTTMVALKKFMVKGWMRALTIILMLILMAMVAIGRVLSGDHSVLDVVAGAGFGVIFGLIYWLIIREKRQHE